MSKEYKITLTDLAISDADGSRQMDATVPSIAPPEGGGWTLQYSLRGQYKIYHFWVRGDIRFDSGYETCWTGIDDNLSTQTIGGGKLLIATTEVNNPITSIDVNLDLNYAVYIYGGQAIWQNAGNLTDGNNLSVDVYTRPTQLQTMVNLDLALEPVDGGNKIKYIGPGMGTHGFAATPVLFQNRENTGWWSYDPQSNTLVPSLDQTGNMDIYDHEMKVSRFMNSILIFGTQNTYKELTSPNAWKIPEGYFLKVVLENRSNTVWSVGILLNLIRETTI